MAKPSDEEWAGRLALFFTSLGVGGVVGVNAGIAMYNASGSVVAAIATFIVVGFAAGLTNPFVAARCVEACEALHKWGFPDTYERWGIERRLYHAAAWPVALPFWLVVATFYAAINRSLPR